MTVVLTLLLLQSAAPPAIRFEPFEIKTFDGQTHQAELGRLSVPERRDERSGRTIEIAFVRLRSRSQAPKAPVVFLSGGPGVPGVVMAQVPIYFQLFDRLRDVADVVLLDQRGTGRSVPTLDCPATESLPVNVFADESAALKEIIRRAAACASTLRAKGIDLAAYNSAAIADDLEDLRRGLGADRLNLLAFSYGTEIALHSARTRPGSLERVVLAGTRGPDQLMRLPTVLDTQVWKLAFLEKQQSNPPVDLVDVLQQVMHRLAERPASLVITDRRTKQPVTVTAGPIAVQALLQGEISDGRAIAGVPVWLRSLHAGDSAAFARRVEQLYHGLASPPLFGTVVNCAAGWSKEREAQAAREARTAMLGSVMNFLLKSEVCEAIGVPSPDSIIREPIRSPVPALFLSGTLDAQTPPMQAEQVRFGFPHSLHLIVENGSHEVLPIEAVQTTVVDFFKGQDVSGRVLHQLPPKFGPAASK